MADVAENLCKFLLGDSGITRKVGARISQDAIPQGKPDPFIWYQRTSTESERCLGETDTAIFKHEFAVECIGENLDDVDALAILVRTKCETLACGGTFGDTTVSNVFCEEQTGDYEPKAVAPNTGLHIAPLRVEVYP